MSCGPGTVEAPRVTPLGVAPSPTAFAETFLLLLFAMAHLLCVGKLFRITQTVLVNFFQNLHFGRKLCQVSSQLDCVTSVKTYNAILLFRPTFTT